ncbi:MAG: mobile mystery protein B [Alphaproteobacteria bacterium]
MSDRFSEPSDSTPLTPDELEGLLPTWIATRADLNAAEAENIAVGAAWARRRQHDILTNDFVRTLHRRMFEDVWKWAGGYRHSERNIGVEPYRITVEVRQLLDDTKFWVENETYEPIEIAVRLHHRLVSVHPFPDGNGRHSRLMADLLAARLGYASLSWGRANLIEAGEDRKRYISALHAADDNDIEPLIDFAQS